jgi:hypothetical protein
LIQRKTTWNGSNAWSFVGCEKIGTKQVLQRIHQ